MRLLLLAGLLAASTALDDAPQIRITPARTRTFRLQIRMHACSAAPCAAGFGIFRQQG